MEINLTELSNDSLLELLSFTLDEASRRKDIKFFGLDNKEKLHAIKSKISSLEEKQKQEDVEYLSMEAERKFKKEQAEKEEQERLERINKKWNIKQRQAQTIAKILKIDISSWYITVWVSPSNEKRVYINTGVPFDKNTINVACLYITGNNMKAPNSFWFNKDLPTKYISDMKNVMHNIGIKWKEVSFNCGEALSYQIYKIKQYT